MRTCSWRLQLAQLLPPAWPASLTIAEQWRKHNARIHAASGLFYVRSTKGGSVCLLTTHICFFGNVPWLFGQNKTPWKASCWFAPNPYTNVCRSLKILHVWAGRQPLHRQLCVFCVCVCLSERHREALTQSWLDFQTDKPVILLLLVCKQIQVCKSLENLLSTKDKVMSLWMDADTRNNTQVFLIDASYLYLHGWCWSCHPLNNFDSVSPWFRFV